MADAINVVRASAASEDFGEVMEYVQAFDIAMLQFGDGVFESDTQSKVMAAAALYSGIVFARLMFVNAVRQSDTARSAKMVSVNFRNGIKVGLAQANRVALEKGYGGHA